MAIIETPEVKTVKSENQASMTVGSYRIHVLPKKSEEWTEATHVLYVDYSGREQHSEIYDSFEAAMEDAMKWVAVAIENETECEE